MEEIWKDIPGYEGLYQVSNQGRVKSLERMNKSTKRKARLLEERIMSPTINKEGYKRVSLHNRGYKRFLIHRLVAMAFIPNPDNLPIINHKDENPSNNNVENLEWCTRKYNNNYGTASARMAQTLRDKDVSINHVLQYSKDGNFIAEYISVNQAARVLGFCSTSIFRACNGESKTSYGFIWRFKNKSKKFIRKGIRI